VDIESATAVRSAVSMPVVALGVALHWPYDTGDKGGKSGGTARVTSGLAAGQIAFGASRTSGIDTLIRKRS
jgi:hypothetical protein